MKPTNTHTTHAVEMAEDKADERKHKQSSDTNSRPSKTYLLLWVQLFTCQEGIRGRKRYAQAMVWKSRQDDGDERERE